MTSEDGKDEGPRMSRALALPGGSKAVPGEPLEARLAAGLQTAPDSGAAGVRSPLIPAEDQRHPMVTEGPGGRIRETHRS